MTAALAVISPAKIHHFDLLVADLRTLSTRVPTVITTRAEYATVSEVASRVREIERALELDLKAALEEPSQVVKIIRDHYRQAQGPAAELKAKLAAIITAYTREENARLARERAEKERAALEAANAEAEAAARALAARTAEERAAADAAMAETARASIQAAVAVEEAPQAVRGMRTDTGMTYLRKTITIDEEHIDYDAVPLEYWRRPRVLEALRSELRAAVRGGVREIPGVAIIEQEAAVIR